MFWKPLGILLDNNSESHREGSGFWIPPGRKVLGEKPNLGEGLVTVGVLLLLLLLMLFKGSEIERLVLAFVELVMEFRREASTSFLERRRPLCTCLSQYLWSGSASLLHLHFFPSVLLHLPGSGSIPPLNSICKPPDPKTKNLIYFIRNYCKVSLIQYLNWVFRVLTAGVELMDITIETIKGARYTLPNRDKEVAGHGKPGFHVFVDERLKL